MINSNTQLQTASVTFLALIGLGVFLHLTQSFMVPFVIAVLLSFLLIPMADFLVRIKVPTILANIISILWMFVLLTGLFFAIYGALSSVTSRLPFYMERYREYFEQIPIVMQQYFDIDLSNDSPNVSVEALFNIISPSSIMGTINQSIGTAISFISSMTLLIIFLIFILSSRRILIDKVYAFFHAKDVETNINFKLIRSITDQIQTYLFLKTLISIGTGALFGFVAFLIGLDFPFIWGFLGFVLNFIPTLGPIIASIPPIFLAFLQFDNVWWAVFSAILLSAVQFTSGNFVEPLIMGNRLNLNIIAILLSLLLMGLIWGIPGMILAVPITAALNIIFRNIPNLQNISILLSK